MNPIFRRSVVACLLVNAVGVASEAAIRVEAYRGQPFGVGRVRIDLPSDASASASDDDRISLTDDEGRVLYPVLEQRRIGRIVRQFINIDIPNRATFYFLFTGDGPLRLNLDTPYRQQLVITPEQDREDFDELFNDWWEATGERYQKIHRNAAYPIVVENYITANWARRLHREMPEPGLHLFGQRKIGGSWVSQLTANESYQALIERDLVLGRFGAGEAASVSLPQPLSLRLEDAELPPGAPEVLPAPPSANVEPLAGHVPEECFYQRFGNFPNYLWYRDFVHHWNNDLGNMILLRSINRGARDRLQQQLCIRESHVGRVMGPKVVRDVAFIGLDYYVRDGASFGIIFQANNNLLLGRNFNSQRDEAVAKNPDAKLETVTIAGHEVSFLSTPDGKLRSYYAVDGDFHLISTCRRLVERFYEAGAGNGSLGGLAEFQTTRAVMPVERDDTVFLYLSAPFFRNMASPAFRVELDRRLRSIGEMRVLELARLAAAAEGSSAQSVDELIAADFLPRGFGHRVDGSQLLSDEGVYRDSLRGTPGWFLPLADTPVDKVTPAEAQHVAEFMRSIDTEVGRFVPVVAAFQRQTSDDGKFDRITADIRITPYSQTRMAKWARKLGPVDTQRVAPIAGDVASLQLIVDALGQPVHLFGGLRDFRTPLVVRQGEPQTADRPAEFVRGYFGTWPRPFTLIDRFLGRPAGPPDADGIARNEGFFSLNLWQRRVDDFFLFAFSRDVLMEVGPQLAMVDGERPAQIRLWVDDLHDKQIATGVNGYGYSRTRDASAAASRFMNSLTTQLHVPPEQAHDIAERLVGGHFVCPLGGEYVMLDATSVNRGANGAENLPAPDARKLWASTATTPQNRFLLTEIPADYQMPLMEWFRGLNLEVARNDPIDALTVRAELDMVHQETAPPAAEGEDGGFKLPGLGNLFGFGASKEGESDKEPK